MTPKGILQKLAKDEGDQVAQMHGIGAWASARVQEEGHALFIQIQDLVKVAMAIKRTATHQRMSAFPSEPLKSGNGVGCQWLASKLDHELFIIDAELLAVHHLSFYVPW